MKRLILLFVFTILFLSLPLSGCTAQSMGVEKTVSDTTKAETQIETETETVNEVQDFSTWQRNNKYYDKQFSILGDSISTLTGYNPDGYRVFFKEARCEKSGVNEMEDTYWGKVINFFGGNLLVNNSWSGSRVTKMPDRDTLFPSGVSDERTSGLHIDDIKPDIIIINLGTNDWGHGVEPLYAEYSDENSTPMAQEFTYAYNEMLSKLKQNYPDAEIWCCTICTACMSSEPSFEFEYEREGKHITQYNRIIRETAKKQNCNLVDLYAYGMPYDSIDGVHPNSVGMKTLAKLMIQSIGGEDAEQYIDSEIN